MKLKSLLFSSLVVVFFTHSAMSAEMNLSDNADYLFTFSRLKGFVAKVLGKDAKKFCENALLPTIQTKDQYDLTNHPDSSCTGLKEDDCAKLTQRYMDVVANCFDGDRRKF